MSLAHGSVFVARHPLENWGIMVFLEFKKELGFGARPGAEVF